MDNSLTPKIRFKGFTDAWEQRKLSDYLEVSSEKNTNDIYVNKMFCLCLAITE